MPQPQDDSHKSCSEDRRRFLKASALSLVAASAIPRWVHAAPGRESAAETVVGEFYKSLSDSQRSVVCLPFENKLREQANANWHVTKPLIGNSFYTDSQRGMIEKIVQNVTSEEGYKRLVEQMEYDDGGLSAYSVAVFGNPQEGSFEWVLTGRHLTLRADGDTQENTAFGGPMVYGHGEESSASDNIFYYQTLKVNEVFKALDKDQAAKALLTNAPRENDVRPKGESGEFPGLAVGEMSSDQKALVRDVLKTILAPYRKEDGDEALSIIDASGGIEKLRFAFYQQGDLEDDRIWDIWRIEGPSAVCHFRGAPHVHAYMHIAKA